MNDLDTRLPQALLALRVTVFLVMFVWTLDKFINPAHAGAVFENFYYLADIGPALLIVIGLVELIIIVLFLVGIARFWTYGAVLVFHAISTLSSWKMYLAFDNLLFFAAWPMLGACFALFWLREHDTLLTMGVKR